MEGKKSVEKDAEYYMFEKCGGAQNVYGKATFTDDKIVSKGAFSGDPKKSEERKEARQNLMNHDNGEVCTNEAHQNGIKNVVKNKKSAQKKAEKRER